MILFSLQLEIIYSFEQLRKQFVVHFDSSKMQPMNSNSRFSIQREGLTLRNYIVYFNAAILEIRSLNE